MLTQIRAPPKLRADAGHERQQQQGRRRRQKNVHL